VQDLQPVAETFEQMRASQIVQRSSGNSTETVVPPA
jgi:hypothetical protein